MASRDIEEYLNGLEIRLTHRIIGVEELLAELIEILTAEKQPVVGVPVGVPVRELSSGTENFLSE